VSDPLPEWARVWRTGLAPALSAAGLAALAEALDSDDPRLIQSQASAPPAMECYRDRPVEAADCLGIALWLGDGHDTVGPLHDAREAVNRQAFRTLGTDAWHLFWAWYDDTPRDEMRRLLLAEVRRCLAASPRCHLPGAAT
jgi:hypothetical protein